MRILGSVDGDGPPSIPTPRFRAADETAAIGETVGLNGLPNEGSKDCVLARTRICFRIVGGGGDGVESANTNTVGASTGISACGEIASIEIVFDAIAFLLHPSRN